LGSFRNGNRIGVWVFYYDNGRLDSKGTYKNGERDGPWVGYHEDGTVWKIFTGTFKDGVKVSD
jgi:antitoxin component YwqK of YwqJK toxin-antitoxin module